MWTPAAGAPAGTLSHALEGQRHDFFIELAQKGDIDLVFFGTTTTEMWWWPTAARASGTGSFGSLKAANFGSQGTHPDSLVWRMQNGELDGYQAKLVVLKTCGHPISRCRRRSPLCRLARGLRRRHRGNPRASAAGQDSDRSPHFRAACGQTIREWRKLAAANAAALASLVDDETVFYADIGERFYRPDGSYNGDIWGGPAGVGAQPPLYELWAEELQPWLDRFVR